MRKKYGRKKDLIGLSLVRLVFAGVICFLFSFLNEFTIQVTFHSILILVLTRFIGTGLAYSVQLTSQKTLEPSLVSLIGILNPIFGMIGVTFIADANGFVEPLNANKIIGSIIILITLIYYFRNNKKSDV